jgi:phosphate transport system permease protein
MQNQAVKGGVADAGDKIIDLRKKPRPVESIIQTLLFLCGAISIATTIGTVVILGREAVLLFSHEACRQSNQSICEDVTLVEFLTEGTWQPQLLQFGVSPLVMATLLIGGIAMLVSLPTGLGAAIYLSEYASLRVRNILKPILEILAGIPTVVYGYFALTFASPLLRSILGTENVNIFNMAAAGIVMGIMILPLVASLSEDALSAVPDALRQASFGLGATKYETTVKVVLPAAFSGIVASFIIAISRAVGETMIVAVAAGQSQHIQLNVLRSAETMTAYIARISGGDTSYDSVDYNTIFVVGFLLFLITLVLNMFSRYLVDRYREVYE